MGAKTVIEPCFHRYTRKELTDFGLLKRGPAAVEEEAQNCMLTLAAERLQQLIAANGAEAGKQQFKCDCI